MFLGSRPFRLLYRLAQRLIVLEGASILTVRAAEVIVAECNLDGIEIRPLTHEQVQHFAARGVAPYCESLLERVCEQPIVCIGAVSKGELLSFAWFHQGSAEAWMNYGRSEATATPIQLRSDAAFIFHAYTSPHARGRRLLSAVLAQAASLLRESHGVNSFVATTEIVNHAAHTAFRRAGFSVSGTYWRIGLGRCVFGFYPKPEPPIIAFNPS